MANTQVPNIGFQPSGDFHRANPYVLGGTVYQGDAVKLSAGTAVQAGATDAILGVALAYGTTGQTIMVADDPNQLFEAQALNSTNAPAASDVGAQVSTYIGTANTTYKTSGMALDYSTKATSTSTLVWKIMGYAGAINNDTTSAYFKAIVSVNKHQLAQGAGIVAI